MNMRRKWESIEKVEKHQGIFTKNALTRLDGSKHDNKTQWVCNGETNNEKRKHTENEKKMTATQIVCSGKKREASERV